MTTMHDPRADTGDDRDAWLAEALRHAPDAGDAAPPMLRETILARAREAAARAPTRAATPTFGERLLAAWSALARPPVAAGFATVMVAVLLGVMWQGRPIDEALLPPSPSQPPLRDAPPATVAAPVDAATADAKVRAPVPAAARSTAPPPAPPAATGERKQAAPASPPRAEAARIAPPQPEPFPGGAGAPAELAAAERRAEKPAAAAQERAADDRRADAMSNAAATPMPARARAAAPALAKAEAEADSVAVAPATDAPPKAAAFAAGISVARPMAPVLRALVGREPRDGPVVRWTRVGPDGAESAVDTSFADWLASVDGAVAGRWQAGAAPRQVAPRGGAAVELRRDGRSAATLRIDDDAVSLRDGDGHDWFAPLGPGVAAPLRAALPPPR